MDKPNILRVVEENFGQNEITYFIILFFLADRSNLQKATSQDADSNKIRISVNHDQNGGGNGNAGSISSTGGGSGNRASLEESFNTKLVMKKKKNNHYIKSNSKSMTNL